MMRRAAISMMFVVSLSMIACGGGQTSALTGPSPAAGASAAGARTGGATISGTVLGVGSRSAIAATSGGMTVSVTGTPIASSVDGSGHFSLANVPTGHVDLHFLGSGADAHLGLDGVEEQESIEVTVHVSGSTADLDDEHAETPDNKVEIEGLVTMVNAAARTLEVGQKTVNVPDGTPIMHGNTSFKLSDVKVNDRVHVHGTISGSAVTATRIELQNDHTGQPADGSDDGNGGGTTDLEGSISLKSGTCPSLTFTVSSTVVKTNSGTDFQDAACSALTNGDRVEVQGTKQSNNSVLATRVEKKD